MKVVCESQLLIDSLESHELFISSPPCTSADASDYVTSLLCVTLLVGSVTVQC